MKTQWQLTYDTEHAPAFGLDMVDSDEAADVAAQRLHEEGRENIVLTMFEDDAPVQSWAFDKIKWGNWRVNGRRSGYTPFRVLDID